MKITSQGAEFCDAFKEECYRRAVVIGEEFKKLTGLSGSIKLKDFDSGGGSICIIRSACGRGCCPSEQIGRIYVILDDLMYPGLKINKMRLDIKNNKKIENSYVENNYIDNDKAKGIYKKEE